MFFFFLGTVPVRIPRPGNEEDEMPNSVDEVVAADIHLHKAQDGLKLPLNPKQPKATLRF